MKLSSNKKKKKKRKTVKKLIRGYVVRILIVLFEAEFRLTFSSSY